MEPISRNKLFQKHLVASAHPLIRKI